MLEAVITWMGDPSRAVSVIRLGMFLTSQPENTLDEAVRGGEGGGNQAT